MEEKQNFCKKKLNIIFLHKALIFGGAERLILDLGLSAIDLGHSVTYLTCEYNKNKTFPEFSENKKITVKKTGTKIPSRFLGKFHALCNILRFLWLTFWVIFNQKNYDLIIVDQISYTLPLLKFLTKKKILYYCHFPEKLLNDNNKEKLLVKIYRFIFDKLEEISITMANGVCFNSNFTKETVEKNLKNIKKFKGLKTVLYPCVHAATKSKIFEEKKIQGENDEKYFLSLNRYETRKNIKRALTAYLSKIEFFRREKVKLKIVGGLNQSNPDSKVCFSELESLIRKEGADDMVELLANVTHDEKEALLG